MTIKIAASILNADMNQLAKEIDSVKNHIDWLHVDIMDNHFVPNLSFGKSILETLSKSRTKPLDAHLMIKNPDKWAIEFADAGADSVTFHIEAAKEPKRIISQIKDLKKKVGIAIKPKTNFDEIKELLDYVDVLLVMTVEPGFGGQTFMSDMMEKVSRARNEIDNRNLNVWVQVDGGIGYKTIDIATKSGADFLVVGSAAFSTSDPGKAMMEMREIAIKSHKH